MIDNELDQLSRALIAATDRLNSPDFQERQARYVRDEQALRELADGLEADERAVEAAQAALTRHVQVTYLSDGLGGYEAAEDELFSTAPAAYGADNLDEFSTPRANGALTD